MSELNEMMHKLCPDELEYASIGSLITRIREKGSDDPNVRQVYVVSNTQGMVKAEDYRDNTIHSEDTSNYTIVRENMVAYNPSRLNIGSIARLKYSEAGLVSPMYVVFSVNSQKIMYEYFDHVIKSAYVLSKINSLKEEGARFRFEFSRWDRIIIPVPPLLVQKEIVRMLGKFTKLTTELTTELTAREKQYHYYQRALIENAPNMRTLSLGEVATIKTGSKPEKILETQTEYEYINAGTTNSGYVEKSNCEGDTVTTPSRGQGGIGFVGYQSNPFWLGPLCYKIQTKDNKMVVNRYLYYYLRGFNEKILAFKKEGGTPAVNASDLAGIPIAIPSIDEQYRIIAILDCFDSLCNNTSKGLPAEIEARQKQYEYYRDRLLTFK